MRDWECNWQPYKSYLNLETWFGPRNVLVRIEQRAVTSISRRASTFRDWDSFTVISLAVPSIMSCSSKNVACWIDEPPLSISEEQNLDRMIVKVCLFSWPILDKKLIYHPLFSLFQLICQKNESKQENLLDCKLKSTKSCGFFRYSLNAESKLNIPVTIRSMQLKEMLLATR